jgi:hypothetical protein
MPQSQSSSFKISRSKKWQRETVLKNTRQQQQLGDWPAGIITHVRSACQSYVLQAELTGFLQSNSPNDWPAGCTTHVSFAFQSSTVQAERKAKLCVYGGPKRVETVGGWRKLSNEGFYYLYSSSLNGDMTTWDRMGWGFLSLYVFGLLNFFVFFFWSLLYFVYGGTCSMYAQKMTLGKHERKSALKTYA